MQATIKADKLAALLAGASVAACTDKSVSILNVVQLELDTNTIRLSATDRYRIATGELPLDYAGDPIKVLIANDQVKDLLPWLKLQKNNPIKLSVMDKSLSIDSNYGSGISVPLSDTDYPNLNAVMPTEFEGVSEIYFDSTYLSDVVKVSGKGVRIKWQLSTPIRPALATFSDKHGIEWQYVVMPQRVK